ncbi:MAG TPA: KpsF/GutQ family sugar-phosphate isomerase [Pirellulales bacterium]|jgi:arabinose-5-phosphate isomerase|nr:KpsF/GutQ family sugar-phosphate isomerase [Pirellulales bacterium]
MSSPRRVRLERFTPIEQLRTARAIVVAEGHALVALAQRLDGEFCRAVEMLFRCRGNVITSGMGKAGLIAQKVAATLASTGTRSHWLHPGEARHGDLGRIGRDDVLLILSQSGETEEILRLLPSLVEFGTPVVAIVGRRNCTLGRAASTTIELGPMDEVCSLGLAPTTTTTAMLAVCDALALVTSRMRGFSREDFARFHPAGNLGRQLARVEQHMRPLADCRLAVQSQLVREIFVERSRGGRRTGAIMLTDSAGRLAGLFTDSDLARLFEHKRDAALDRPIREVMTPKPWSVRQGSLMTDAVAVMAEHKISELPVLDSRRRPVGLVDITDVVGLYPEAALANSPPESVRVHPNTVDPAAPNRRASGRQLPTDPPRECA